MTVVINGYRKVIGRFLRPFFECLIDKEFGCWQSPIVTMFQLLSAVLVFVAAAAGQSAASRVRYNTNASRKDGMLNVHLGKPCETSHCMQFCKNLHQCAIHMMTLVG